MLWPGLSVSQTFLTLCEVLGALDLLHHRADGLQDLLGVGVQVDCAGLYLRGVLNRSAEACQIEGILALLGHPDK